jgi:glutamyl-tRNA synthetase
MERVHKGGAKFDYEKAKWYNHQYILHKTDAELTPLVKPFIEAHGVTIDDAYLQQVIALVKERCHLLADFWEQGHFFFKTPEVTELQAIKDKWNDTKKAFFESWAASLDNATDWSHTALEENFNTQMQQVGLKKGDVLLPLRIMLVGGKYGPHVFNIVEMIGKEETKKRITSAIGLL